MSLALAEQKGYDDDAVEMVSSGVPKDAETPEEKNRDEREPLRFGSVTPDGVEGDLKVRRSVIGSLEYLKPLLQQ